MLQYPASWRKKNQFIESMLAIVEKRKGLQKPRILSNKRKCNTFLSNAASYTLTCLKSFHTVWPSVCFRHGPQNVEINDAVIIDVTHI